MKQFRVDEVRRERVGSMSLLCALTVASVLACKTLSPNIKDESALNESRAPLSQPKYTTYDCVPENSRTEYKKFSISYSPAEGQVSISRLSAQDLAGSPSTERTSEKHPKYSYMVLERFEVITTKSTSEKLKSVLVSPEMRQGLSKSDLFAITTKNLEVRYSCLNPFTPAQPAISEDEFSKVDESIGCNVTSIQKDGKLNAPKNQNLDIQYLPGVGVNFGKEFFDDAKVYGSRLTFGAGRKEIRFFSSQLQAYRAAKAKNFQLEYRINQSTERGEWYTAEAWTMTCLVVKKEIETFQGFECNDGTVNGKKILSIKRVNDPIDGVNTWATSDSKMVGNLQERKDDQGLNHYSIVMNSDEQYQRLVFDRSSLMKLMNEKSPSVSQFKLVRTLGAESANFEIKWDKKGDSLVCTPNVNYLRFPKISQ